MDREIKELLREMLEQQQRTNEANANTNRWTLIVLGFVAFCFSVCVVFMAVSHEKEVTNISIEHQRQVSNMTHDYFYSDYDYGTIEQSVDITNGE